MVQDIGGARQAERFPERRPRHAVAKDRCHGPAEGVCVASYDASISNPESQIQNPKSQIEDRRATALLWLLIVVCLACDFLMMPLLAALRGPLGISAIPL